MAETRVLSNPATVTLRFRRLRPYRHRLRRRAKIRTLLGNGLNPYSSSIHPLSDMPSKHRLFHRFIKISYFKHANPMHSAGQSSGSGLLVGHLASEQIRASLRIRS